MDAKTVTGSVIMAALGSSLVIFFAAAAPASVPPPVRLVVEFADHAQAGTTLRNYRETLRSIRELTGSAPRAYRSPNGTRVAADLRRWRVIEVEADKAAVVYQSLRQNPGVSDVHYEQQYHSALLPSDVQWGKQYGLSSGNPLADIKAPAAWDKTTGSSQTVIAIVDGGVDLTHEDLKDKLWVNPREVANNNTDDDGNGFVDDVHGWDFVSNRPALSSISHATHVAGIAAAASNNGIGIAGVDWQARIMSVRVLGGSGTGGEEDIINGIGYAVRSGAKVINLSLVGSPSSALQAAVEQAYAAGVVVVAAAGNSGLSTSRVAIYPACADGNSDMVLGVAATDSAGEPASFSNYGQCINISAPGDDIFSTKVGDNYGYMSGTSMSAPFVAGVAGLYLSLYPGASPAEVIAAISNGDEFTAVRAADAEVWNQNYKRKLNAASAVGAASSSNSADSSSSPAPASQPASGGDSGGGDSGGGGGGGGSEEPAPAAVKKPRVAGAVIGITAADRAAKDFIKNQTVPAVVAKLFAQVFGRKITPADSTYWKARARSDKPTETKLTGAMFWHKLRGKTRGVLKY